MKSPDSYEDVIKLETTTLDKLQYHLINVNVKALMKRLQLWQHKISVHFMMT